jgi:hypothetical protein
MSTDDAAKGNGQTENAKEETSKPMQSSGKSKSAASALAVKSGSETAEADGPRYVLGIRPIEPSHLEVLDITTIPGHRPIFASHLQVVNSDLLPGHRPIMASDPELLNAPMLMMNRPIASNEVDDPETLMGFLD